MDIRFGKSPVAGLIVVALFTLFTLKTEAVNYPGNGATGFGGAVGTGSLDITDSATSLMLTFNRGAGAFNDVLVVYLNTAAGGFSDTSTFMDNADGGRTAISGFNAGNPSQTVVTFPGGFQADFALAIQNGFIGAFQLNAGGNGSLGFLFGQVQTGNNSDPSYSITMSSAQMAQIGLTANSGQTFSFLGTYISTSAYRANETIGTSVTVPGDGAGNAGFSNPQIFPAALSYTLIPEPTTYGLVGIGLLGTLLLRRRKV